MKPAHRSPPSPISPPAIPMADVLAQFTDAVVVLDQRTKIVFVNQAAEELTGRPRSRLVGQPCHRVFASAPLLVEMVERVHQSGQSESRSEEHLLRRGRSIPVQITCLPVWDRSDRWQGSALVIHDLSYQKTLEDTARRNESLARLGTLVAGLAHEVKNPLAGIKGAAQLLEARIGGEPTLAEYTRVITREVNRLSALVEDLLTLGSAPKPRLEPLNVHRVIQHVLKLTIDEMQRHGIRLRCEFDPSLPHVQGDEAQLSQVFLNLVKNAIDAIRTSGKAEGESKSICIRTRIETDFHILRGPDRAGKFLRIDVVDDGVGIDPVDAARMFEPFFTTKPRGTGLGLAISHRIIADHGGIIRAFPNRPTGSTFIVTLPIPTD